MTAVLPEAREAGPGPGAGPRPGGGTPGPPRRGRPRPRTWALLAAVAVVASLVAAVGPALRDGTPLVTGSAPASLGRLAAAVLAPRLDGPFLVLVADAAATTVAYAVLGTAVALVLGAVGGVLGSSVFWRWGRGRVAPHGRGAAVGRGASRVALVVPRAVHEVVWGLVLLSVLGLTPVVAVLAIGIPFGAITARVTAQILDDADPRPAEALLAAGAPRGTAMLYGLLPGAGAELFAYASYRFECALRSAAVLGLVGAGGLGFQLALSFQSLVLPEIVTLLLALVVLCTAADAWSSAVRRRVGAGRGGARGRDRLVTVSLVVALVLLPASALWVGLDLRPLAEARSWTLAADLLAQSWPPRADGLAALLVPAVETLAMSVLAIAVALVGGCALAAVAARDPLAVRRPGPVRTLGRVATRVVLVVLRAVPPPVWALLALVVLLPGLLPGAVALGVYTAGVLGRLVAGSVESVDPAPGRALRAQGASAPQAALYAVVPAVAPRVLAFGLYRWEVTIRETVVVGVVGAGGLGVLLQTQLATFDYGGVLATLAVLVVLTLLVDVIGSAVRAGLPPRSGGAAAGPGRS